MTRSRRSFFDIRYVLLFGIISGLVVYLIFYGFTYDSEGLILSIAYGVFYSTVMWGAQALTLLLVSRYLPLRSKRDVLVRVVIHGAAMVLSFLLTTALIQIFLDPGFLESSGTVTIIALVAFAASILGNGIDYMELLHQRLRRAESAALAAELATLRAQINPHFLFNSLNSIAALIRRDPAHAESLVESLADLFRYSLRTSEHPTVTLAEEIASVELYLTIERARFGERLHVSIEIPPHLARTRVPSLMLQPLVENGIKHGMGRTLGECTLTVEACEEGEDVIVRVSDTGPGFATTDLNELARRGKGLSNVRDRLRHLFGDRASMEIFPNSVALRLPRTLTRETMTQVEMT